MIHQVVKGYSAGLAALKEELKKPELDAANVTELVAEIGEAVADVGDVSRILAAEDNSELGKTFLESWAAINFVRRCARLRVLRQKVLRVATLWC